MGIDLVLLAFGFNHMQALLRRLDNGHLMLRIRRRDQIVNALSPIPWRKVAGQPWLKPRDDVAVVKQDSRTSSTSVENH